ncbi:MAG: homocysteine biosynthesis protein [Bacteroidales bacterium]|nr:homocysteine biosynthesis protein [Bacteroidales bacterium]
MKQKKSYAEINEKIAKGEAVVLTAEEITRMAKELNPEEIVKKVDIVTTSTFGPMCSSGAFINFGHSEPPIRMESATLNNVPIFTGIAAVDAYIGATEESLHDKKYGGAHVIEDLIAGKDIELKATGKGTDCYPRKKIETLINKKTVNEIIMFNPRNAYQNYCVAVNTSNKIKYTYMGVLLPKSGNATYSTSGELSPLLNDPELRTIGIGTRIFLGGAQGYVSWNGTQFNTSVPKNTSGIPKSNSATIAVIGDLKRMHTDFIKAGYFENYGVSIFIGIGIPIPLLDEEIAAFVSVQNKQIKTTVFDYGSPERTNMGTINYKDLQSGEIQINGKKIRTAPLSSISKARTIANELKKWISNKEFFLTEPVQLFPTKTSLNKLNIRGV